MGGNMNIFSFKWIINQYITRFIEPIKSKLCMIRFILQERRKWRNCHLCGQVDLFDFVFLPLFLGTLFWFSLSFGGSTGEGGGGSCCAWGDGGEWSCNAEEFRD